MRAKESKAMKGEGGGGGRLTPSWCMGAGLLCCGKYRVRGCELAGQLCLNGRGCPPGVPLGRGVHGSLLCSLSLRGGGSDEKLNQNEMDVEDYGERKRRDLAPSSYEMHADDNGESHCTSQDLSLPFPRKIERSPTSSQSISKILDDFSPRVERSSHILESGASSIERSTARM